MPHDERDDAYYGGEPPARSRIYLFTPEQLAHHFQVTRRTVYRWLKSGQLAGVRVGRGWRISEREIGRFIGQQGYSFRPELCAEQIREEMGEEPEVQR